MLANYKCVPKSEPILTSLLDTDAYKFYMQQAVFHHYPDTTVVAEFRCRNDELLGQYIDEIKEQIMLMERLRLSEQELAYLAKAPFFKQDYLSWLKTWHYDARMVSVTDDKGQLAIRIEGKWLDVILWEVPLLAVVSEVVHRNRTPHIGAPEAVAYLQEKIDKFRQDSQGLDIQHLNIVDFGTRRRYSKAVQREVIRYLLANFPHFHSTSNYLFAYELGIEPVGTQAHEWFQAHQQLVDNLADCQRKALQVWLDEYPHDLGIALTDCITMDAFLRDFDHHFATSYQGLRHDSGDPIEWGEKAIAHYHHLGIDPRQKTLVFSDSLTLDKALTIYRYFYGRIKIAFGIGGYLTCNLPSSANDNAKSLNIVIKLVECNGKPVAKLSDSPGKTISQDTAFIDQLKRTFEVKGNY